MLARDVEIHGGDQLDHPYRVVGPIQARVGALTIFSSRRTKTDVDAKLREAALRGGGNAVINVRYARGISMTSWKALTATGIAVEITDRDRDCPQCNGRMRRDASTCQRCHRRSEPWQFHDGRWWVTRDSGQLYLDPKTNQWLPAEGNSPPAG